MNQKDASHYQLANKELTLTKNGLIPLAKRGKNAILKVQKSNIVGFNLRTLEQERWICDNSVVILN